MAENTKNFGQSCILNSYHFQKKNVLHLEYDLLRKLFALTILNNTSSIVHFKIDGFSKKFIMGYNLNLLPINNTV